MAKSITLNSIYNFILKVFRLIVPVLVGPYIQRLFDTQLYGSFNDASTWVDLALVFGGFGIYTYAVREVSAVRDDEIGEDVKAAIVAAIAAYYAGEESSCEFKVKRIRRL